jgi:hypothetical protein
MRKGVRRRRKLRPPSCWGGRQLHARRLSGLDPLLIRATLGFCGGKFNYLPAREEVGRPFGSAHPLSRPPPR